MKNAVRSRARPEAAFYHKQLGEFILECEEVRKAESPSTALLAFCQTTYEAGPRWGSGIATDWRGIPAS